MIKTNQEQLVEVGVCGEITHPEVPGYPSLSVGYDGKAFLPVGVGGVAFNVKSGDPAFGWAWGDHVEPGVSIRNADPAANAGLNCLACVGNEATLVRNAVENKEAKGKPITGAVTGKHGGRVLVHFPKRIVERLCVGDLIQVRAAGVGLSFPGYPGIALMNCSPRLLRAVNPTEKGSRVRVTVAKLLPGHLVGAGIGASHAFADDLDIQSVSAETVRDYSLDALRMGDLVAVSDLDCTNGARHQRDAVTIGVVCHGASAMAGHGPGINVLMTAPQGLLEPIITRRANLSELLGLG